MIEKIALELSDDASDGITYYADDGDSALPIESPEKDFHSFFDDEDGDDSLATPAHTHTPENKMDGETLHEIEDNGESVSNEPDHVISFDDFNDEIDKEHDESEPEPSAQVDSSQDPEAGSADENEAFDGLLGMGDHALPGATLEIVTKEPEEPQRDTTWEDDADHSKFIFPYMVNSLKNVPPHSGQTTVGCEKAITYLRGKDKEISRAIQTDTKNQIDERKAEILRDTIHNWIERLEEALAGMMGKKKKKKKASYSVGKTVVARLHDGKDLQYFVSVSASDGEEKLLQINIEEPSDLQVQAFVKGEGKGITKEAGALLTFVDPFLQSITRLLIRSHITQGKDLREVYAQLDAQYKFTPREQLSIHELLMQKGMPLNVDLGRLQEKNVMPWDGKNVEYSTEYFA